MVQSQLRTFCVALIVIAVIHQSNQVPVNMDPHQSIVKEYSPINIIRIKPADPVAAKDHDYFPRKQKSTKKASPGESFGSASSVIVIKPVLAPVKTMRHKTTSKKAWKRMVRRPKFLHDVQMNNNSLVTRVARVHLASGAYPVFYGLAKTNGSFGRIKSITHASD